MTTINRSGKIFTRRRFLHIVAVAGLAAAGWKFGVSGIARPLQKAQASVPIMGTVMNLSLYGPDRDACRQALQQAVAVMRGLEGHLSRHLADSELATLNRTGTLDNPGADLLAVLRLAESLSSRTDGAFDVTILPLLRLQEESPGGHPDPDRHQHAHSLVGYRQLHIDRDRIRLATPGMEVSLDGIGKGYVVDQGVACLRDNGFGNVLVEAGGDLMVTGNKEGRVPWRIGLRPPRPKAAPVTIVASDKAVATSGDYLQAFTPDFGQHHIIDPRSGFSPPELASCTVTAPTAAMADGLATALMVLGRGQAVELIESLPGCEAYLVDKDLQSFPTSGFFS